MLWLRQTPLPRAETASLGATEQLEKEGSQQLPGHASTLQVVAPAAAIRTASAGQSTGRGAGGPQQPLTLLLRENKN